MSYTNLIQRLYKTNVFSPVKLGLENMIRLNSLMGNPIGSIPVVHVTGTNGKGSVSLKIARVLRECGVTTGLFSSPHISSFKERIRVNENNISEADVESIFPPIFDFCKDHVIPATFFELTTALALVKFQRARCEAVVLEVGLGGRLDATNIVSPALCVITAIQMDHNKILGDTIEKIAKEKAGIMKPGVDVLVGPGCPIDVMRAEAERIGANLFTLDDLLHPTERKYNWSDDSVSSVGDNCGSDLRDIDDLNFDIAHAAVRLLQRQHNSVFDRLNDPALDFTRALKTRPPCRFEVFRQVVDCSAAVAAKGVAVEKNSAERRVDVVLDIAHNVDAVRTLMDKAKLLYGDVPIRVVAGMSADKDVSGCLPSVLSVVNHQLDRIHCIAANHPRALPPAELRRLFTEYHYKHGHNNDCNDNNDSNKELSVESKFESNDGPIGETIHSAIRQVAFESIRNNNSSNISSSSDDRKVDGVVLVCGTAFVMADARAALGVVEDRDTDDMFFSPIQTARKTFNNN